MISRRKKEEFLFLEDVVCDRGIQKRRVTDEKKEFSSLRRKECFICECRRRRLDMGLMSDEVGAERLVG